ncbi:C1 family peptidase [Foetidibacter luteolus]|uniref:C1 family peptidase n=1 Tax=Foetidibacter luteolus TaxID=2608880 RepID=UPI00129B9B02|nr:C1 family peptidase [Foetidibacter luteolus]
MERKKLSFGWIPDLPDFRDFTPETPEVKLITSSLKKSAKAKAFKLATSVDLREYCSPVEDQGQIGSCTAQAAVGMIEYFQKRAFNTYLDGSALFVYKVTRNLLRWAGDTGAYLRTAMKTLAGFGICPEEYWPYSDYRTGENGIPSDPFEIEPSSFCYAFAANYKSIKYFRLDTPELDKPAILENIKKYAASGLPSMFGFSVYSSIYSAGATGKIPYPNIGESRVGGHAVMVVGYDDAIEIQNGNNKTTGAFLIRNSWGISWGESGYGYLPYEYVLRGLAEDFWSIISADFLDTGNFRLDQL